MSPTSAVARSPQSVAKRSNRPSDWRRTNTQTSASGRVSSSRDTTRRPINPVPPVTRYRMPVIVVAPLVGVNGL